MSAYALANDDTLPDVATRPELGRSTADTDKPPNWVTITFTNPTPLKPMMLSVRITVNVTLRHHIRVMGGGG